jgi:protein arginine kinase activator
MAEQQCQRCGKADAVVNLTTIVSDEMKTEHLCEACAAEKGLESGKVPDSFPLTDFLAQMGEEPTAGMATSQDAVNCTFCGLSFAGFRESGRLGCPHCYSTFETHLRGLLRRIHGSTQHIGKVYLPPDPSQNEREKRLEGLRRKLSRAVDSEDFERAAQLRDQIRALEPVT